MSCSAAGGWEIWFRKAFACADIKGQEPWKNLGYPGYRCCLRLLLSEHLPSASLCPGAFIGLAGWTGSARYLHCFSYIRPFNHQQTVSAFRRIHQPPKTCPASRGRAQALVGCFVSSPGPSCSFRDSDPVDFRGKRKKALWHLEPLIWFLFLQPFLFPMQW